MITADITYNLDVEECKNTNIMVTGQTSSGKTRLLWGIANVLRYHGFLVYAIDPIGNYRYSPIPNYEKIHRDRVNIFKIWDISTVYDVSELRISEQREFVNKFCLALWESRQDSDNNTPTMVILEEVQNYCKNLRSETAENILQLAMSGRNRSIRLAYACPRLNNINAEMRFLAGQRFHGSSWESNVLAKIKGLYGKEIMEMVKRLRTGEFLYHKPPEQPYVISVPCFPDTHRDMIKYTEKYTQTNTEITAKKYMRISNILSTITSLVITTIIILWLIS